MTRRWAHKRCRNLFTDVKLEKFILTLSKKFMNVIKIKQKNDIWGLFLQLSRLTRLAYNPSRKPNRTNDRKIPPPPKKNSSCYTIKTITSLRELLHYWPLPIKSFSWKTEEGILIKNKYSAIVFFFFNVSNNPLVLIWLYERDKIHSRMEALTVLILSHKKSDNLRAAGRILNYNMQA